MNGSLTIYGLPNCDKCRRAKRWLDEQDIAYQFIDYRMQPPSDDTIKGWAKSLGGWEILINKASRTWRALSDEEKQLASDDDWLALVQSHRVLVKRPVVVTADGEISTGFSEDDFATRFAS